MNSNMAALQNYEADPERRGSIVFLSVGTHLAHFFFSLSVQPPWATANVYVSLCYNLSLSLILLLFLLFFISFVCTSLVFSLLSLILQLIFELLCKHANK
jgi:hypothetical protein